jgi:magnesium-transporting ATPase (P-type)
MLEGPYKRHFDFGRRYASYAEGAKRAQKALNKYAFYRILLVVIVEVVVVSVYQYPGNSLISEDIKATFDENFNVSSMVSVFLLLAAASTVGTFFTYSYKEGSFARLVMAGLVAACSVLWAMFYYGSIAAQVHPESTMWAILLIMGAALLITGARGLYELHTKFLMNRDWYLTTRLYLVGTEAKYIKPKPETAPGQVSTIAPPGSLNGRGA